MRSGEHQAIAMRARPDLVYQQQTYQGQAWWIVKDPISLKYFRIRPEAYTSLRMLDGGTSLDQIKTELERAFPKIKVEYADLYSMLGMLHRYGLVLAQASGQGEQLYQRRGEQRRRQLLGQLSSILFLRLPGVDPERFLSWLYPKVRWFYSRWCVALCATLVLSSWLLVILHFHEFYAKLPGFHEFFRAGNIVWMMLALGCAKILHEIGHGMTCKHYGGECHQIGLMFLVFTPCLYCDTSDAWILPNKWHRAAIGAAGMYVEVVLAAVFTFVWWNSEPGLLHYLALNTMFICSVSTVIFNSNPLLRYDGYYILSDVLEIPNLGQKSRMALVGLLRKWCLGMPWQKELAVPPRQRVTFATYAVASFCYRWFILVVILLFLSKFLKPYGLQALAHLLIATSLVGLIVVPTWRAVQFLLVPGRMQQVKKSRLLTTMAVVAALTLAVVYLPLPHRVMTSAVVEAGDAERVYVNVPGVLTGLHVEQGQRVEAGQRLAVLQNPEVDYQITRLTGQLQRSERQLQNLRRQQGTDADAAQQIPHTAESLVHIQQRLDQLRQDQRRLELVAQQSGVVMSPHAPSTSREGGSLPMWSGTPLDDWNLGSWLETGTLFCVVGDPRQLEAVLVIDQMQIDFIGEGQLVEIMLDEYPGEVWSSRIDEIAEVDLQRIPRELSVEAGGELAGSADDSGEARPASTSYQARVSLDNADQRLLPGFRGRAKIRIGSRTLGKAIWRYLAQTFRLG
jgi:putative peptide zinc metalloprotease protein